MSVMSDSEAAPLSDDPRVTNHERSITYLSDTGQNASDEVSERIWRTIISAIVPCGAILFVIDFNLYASFMEILAIVMLCIFIPSTLRFIWLIYRAQNMYRLCSRSKIVPKWTTMTVAYKIMQFKKQSIHSISSFSAIKGGDNITSFLIMSENIWLIMMALFVFRMTQNTSKPDLDNLNIDDVLMVIGVFGLLIQSIWDLNPWSTVQKVMHFIGVLCWSMVIVGYGVQTNWNYSFYILLGLMMLFFVIWFITWINAKRYNGDNAKTISLYSKVMLISEICMLWQGIIALVLWVYYHDYYNEIQL